MLEKQTKNGSGTVYQILRDRKVVLLFIFLEQAGGREGEGGIETPKQAPYPA